MNRSLAELWMFLPFGYLLTVAIEIPVLLIGLSPTHPWKQKLLAGLFLTACTYPIVVFVLPLTVEHWWGRSLYFLIAEVFAPLAECLLFRLAYPIPVSRSAAIRDMVAIVAANLSSFLIGMLILNWSIRSGLFVIR